MSNPLNDLLNFAQRSYVRMEAEQLIQECLALNEVGPLNKMIEALVLDGPSSIYLLREVLEELQAAQSTISQEGLGVRHDLMEALSQFDIRLPNLLSVHTADDFRKIVLQRKYLNTSIAEGQLNTENEALLLEIWSEAGERVLDIAKGLSFLKQLEEIIRDWIGSLAYEIMRSSQGRIEYGTTIFRQ